MDEKRNLMDELKQLADPINAAAIPILEGRGFMFCTHFGYENAAEILRGMDRAADMGDLYEWLRTRMGVV